ncbi:hypothetical protein cypCar_00004410, partial [Cyprinus carpio]
MAPVTTEEAHFAEVPVSVAVVSVFGMVFSVSIFAWICCQRKGNKASNKTPPYKFVHMLKGVDIYPESLNGKKKFGGEKTPEAHGKQTLSPSGGRSELHLDLEKRDLNGNFTSKSPTLQLKVRSSPDLDIPSLQAGFGSGGNQEAGTPESILSSQTPTPAVEKSQDKEGGLGTLYFSVEYNFEKKAFMRSAGRGELLLSLCYQSTTSTLTVVVLKARHLPKTDSNGPS